MNNLPYYLGFSHFLGIGPLRFRALVNHFGEVKKAYEADVKEIAEVIGQKEIAEKFSKFRREFNLDKKIEEITKKGICVLTQEDILYPTSLKNIPDIPICLYVRGNLEDINLNKNMFFGIVGTRKATAYGSYVTKKFSHELSQNGFILVSGLALGIDVVAHKAALDNDAKTIAFLGCGVDIVYPPANRETYDRIVNGGGLVISEFPPGMTTMPGLFVARNRLISGLSKGVLVVEGAKDSGSLITARYAAIQGRDVFAVPSPITSILSEAPNLLLKEGAKLVTSVQDILEEYEIELVKNNMHKFELKGDQKNIYDFLMLEPQTIDKISLYLSQPVHNVLPLISMLELQGAVEKNSEGKYQVK